MIRAAWAIGFISAAVAGAVASSPASAEVEGFRPLRLAPPAADPGDCRAFGSPHPGMPSDVVVTLKIAADGRVRETSLPDKSPHWLKALAECAASRLTFEPEMRDGKASDSRASLTLTIAPVTGGEPGSQHVTRIRSLLTAPRLRAGASRVLEGCLVGGPPRGAYSRFLFRTTLDPEGRIVRVDLPVDAPRWLERTAACLKDKLRFFPGTHDGIAVGSEATVPIALDYSGMGGKVQGPEPPTDLAQLEEAYRACYPPDQAAMTSIFFRFDVNADGSVSNARLVRGSGDAALDRAGACVLTRLRFTPMTRDGKPEKSTVTWELPLRPPR